MQQTTITSTTVTSLLGTLALAPLVRRLIMLLCACVAGDMLLRLFSLTSTTTSDSSSPKLLIPLVLDNATHAILGLLSWWVVLAPPLSLPPPPSSRPPPALPLPLYHSPPPTSQTQPHQWRLRRTHLFELVMAFVLSSALDLDHFFAAKTWSLNGALHLTQRPPAHCLTTLLGVTGIVWATLRHGGGSSRGCWRKENSVRYSALFLVATLSHQLRDAVRRGLWFCHLGVSTPPLVYLVYMLLMLALPLGVRRILKKESRQEEEGDEDDNESVLWQRRRREYRPVSRREEDNEEGRERGGVELPDRSTRSAMVVV